MLHVYTPDNWYPRVCTDSQATGSCTCDEMHNEKSCAPGWSTGKSPLCRCVPGVADSGGTVRSHTCSCGHSKKDSIVIGVHAAGGFGKISNSIDWKIQVFFLYNV